MTRPLFVLLVLVFSTTLALGCGDDGAAGDAATDTTVGTDTSTDTSFDTALPTMCDVDSDCDDGRFCSGVETCGGSACARGSSPCVGGESCNEGAARCDPIGTGGGGLPVGIPTPSFGWELDTGADATIYVDNTNAACDDSGAGTAAAPLCDLFRGRRATSYDAGDVVHVLGGPYPVDGDYALTMNGTEAAPVLIVGQGSDRILFDGGGSRANFDWEGSYGVIENIDFFHQTRHGVRGDNLLLRNIAVHNPAGSFIDFNPVVSVTGHDVLIEQSEIFNNRRMSDTDSHGIQSSEGSYNVWILDNELYNNNGDSFQGCHQCFGTPPHHIYLGRNVMHDDRENGIDLKTIHDVVISENVLYGYGSSATSNGDAMVIGSNGFDDSINQGPRRVWVINNELRDSATGIRIEGSEDVWLLGNVFKNLGRGVQIDDKPHRLIVIAANTMSGINSEPGVNIWGCQPQTLTIANNIIDDVAGRHIDVQECGAPALTIHNNLFGGGTSVRADRTQHADVASLDAEGFAMGNVGADPTFEGSTLVPASGSPAENAGTALDAYYDAFTTAFGPDIAIDRAGTPRPTGAAQDIGAYERP